MDATQIKEKIDLLSRQLSRFEEYRLQDLWETKKEIYELFKLTEFASPEERKSVSDNFQLMVDTLDIRQKELTEENEKFASEADAMIDAYCGKVEQELAKDGSEKEKFSALRKTTDEVFEFIRQSKWPSKERRTAGWDRFQATRDKWKALEDNWYAERREKLATLTEGSSALQAQINPMLDLFAEGANGQTIIDAVTKFNADQNAPCNEEWLSLKGEEAEKQSLKVRSGALNHLRRFMIDQRERFTHEHRDGIVAVSYTHLTLPTICSV